MTTFDTNGRLLAVLALLATMFFWGSAAVFIRTLALSLSPENALALRYAIMTVINVVGLLALGSWRVARADWPRFLIAGLVGMAGYNWFVNQGFALVPAGIGTVITSVEPLMLALLAILLLKERLTPFVLLGLLVALAGVVVLFWKDLVTGVSTISPKGATALWICAFCWALYTVLAVPLVEKYGSFAVTAITMIIAAPVLILPASEPLGALAMKLDARQWAELVYLIVPNGLFGTILWNYGAQRLSQAATGAFLYLIPVIAIICGWAILDEAITPNAVWGGLLSIAGVALAQFGPVLVARRA